MNLQELDLKLEYRSKVDDIIRDFYIPVLKRSVLYRRAVGFFSSSALLALSAGICGIVKNGGKIELIASPKLSSEDIDAINDGVKRRDEVIEEVLLRELHEHKGKFEEARLNLLSNLIAVGRLKIKIAFLENDNGMGMFHEKLGLMYDDNDNIIAFSGSMNESANAFINNYEAIDVFTSWSEEKSRVFSKVSTFDNMWNDCEPSITVLEFPKINSVIIEKYKTTDKIKLFPEELYLSEEFGVTEDYEEKDVGPSVPVNIDLRKYQLEAVDAWVENGYNGIFDMATGTGKTYTALAAISRLYQDININKNLAVIIVCPYQHLVEQWREDVVAFGMKPIICYSASQQKNWRERLKTAVNSFNAGVIKHFCMLSTNATFSLDYVQAEILKLSGNIVLVVDEAHNFGADKLSKTLLSHIPYRLALSATIDRHGDPEGTQKLYDYFGKKCIEYTLEAAIKARMLTQYYYHPIPVSLNEEELSQYLELSEKIRRNVYPDKKGKIELSEYVKMLLIKRARIVAGASEKISVLYNIMKSYKDKNQILVYCGATTMRDVDYEEGKIQIDEARQIDIVSEMLGNDLGMRVSKFTSAETAEERERIKENFAEGKHLQVLVAIRCLDEGVNIPSIQTAFILASSTNPKEYVQRRGRVLRKFPGKTYATIFDFITLPIPLENVANYDPDIINSVRSLARREIIRIEDFASIAENPYDSDSLISEIKRNYDIKFIDEEEDSAYV
ncbi:MAG: DEAD/DEAH box helicase family protein [Ruminococcaceae bacterium]|nr:DEAD/DEAH box helicase family protein [Oscillospiraceae bacterium]